MDLRASDDTDPNRVMRRICTVNGRRIKTRIYFDVIGADGTPQKSILKNRENYDLRSWTQPGRFFGTQIWRPRRK